MALHNLDKFTFVHSPKAQTISSFSINYFLSNHQQLCFIAKNWNFWFAFAIFLFVCFVPRLMSFCLFLMLQLQDWRPFHYYPLTFKDLQTWRFLQMSWDAIYDSFNLWEESCTQYKINFKFLAYHHLENGIIYFYLTLFIQFTDRFPKLQKYIRLIHRVEQKQVYRCWYEK